VKKGKDIITLPAPVVVPADPPWRLPFTLPVEERLGRGHQNRSWMGQPQVPCLIERFLESLPPHKRAGAVTMISCPCPRCSPYSLG
jgi:hypothetical protein